MIYKLRRITHAVWEYLNQPVTHDEAKYSVWNFKRFSYLYQIKLLETCLSKDSFAPKQDSRGQDEYQTGN